MPRAKGIMKSAETQNMWLLRIASLSRDSLFGLVKMFGEAPRNQRKHSSETWVVVNYTNLMAREIARDNLNPKIS